MRKRIAIIVAALIILAGGAWLLDLPARLGLRRAQSDALTLYGNVDIRQVELGFRVSGRIKTMHFDEGDSVTAGALLAELDASPYESAKAANDALAAQKAATLDKLVAGPRPAEIDQARANVAERQADLDNAQRAYDRARSLRPAGVVSQQQLDDATAAKNMAAARLASSQQALRLLEEGTRPEDIAGARADLQSAQANQASAATQLADTQLLAPADGVVLSRVREPGAIVAPSDVVYVVSLNRPVWVRAYVAEPQLGQVHPGLAVTVTTDTAPGHAYHGHVGFVSPVAEFTPKTVETQELRTDLVYRLRVIVEDPDQALRQGMPVTVAVPQGTATAQGG